jgi:hypothetical protein
MGHFVYTLCALMSVGCAVLLLRQYRLTGGRLLFWSAGCFICFATTNILLFVDLVIIPDVDLSLSRAAISLGGIVMLLAALIWEGH